MTQKANKVKKQGQEQPRVTGMMAEEQVTLGDLHGFSVCFYSQVMFLMPKKTRAQQWYQAPLCSVHQVVLFSQTHGF